MDYNEYLDNVINEEITRDIYDIIQKQAEEIILDYINAGEEVNVPAIAYQIVDLNDDLEDEDMGHLIDFVRAVYQEIKTGELV